MALQPTYDQAVDSALAQLQAFGLEVSALEWDHFVDDIQHRDDRPGKKKGWYIASVYTTQQGGTLVAGAYGTWTLPGHEKFVHEVRGLSAAEKADLRRRQAEAKRATEAARARKAEEAARRAAGIWDKLPEQGPSDYLARKRVAGFGVRYSRGSVVVPVRTITERLVGLQFIDADGGKKFLTGTAKKGAFHLVGDITTGGPLAVCEGVATGFSVHMATGWPVAIAFDAGNLDPVARALRGQHPLARLILCADDDWTKPENTGRTAAQAAARAVKGQVLLPVFAQGDRGTDWNDLHVTEGLEVVRTQLHACASLPVPAAQEAAGREHGEGENWDRQLLTTGSGNLAKCQTNVRLILDHDPHWDGVLGFNEFTGDIQKLKPPPVRGGETGPWQEEDTLALVDWMALQYRFEPNEAHAIGAVKLVAQSNPYHPIRAFLEGLTWDGQGRIDSWLIEYLGADIRLAPYLRVIGAKWLIGAVARAHARRSADKSGLVDMRNVLILEGEQRIGKSTALRILGGPWFSDSHVDFGGKDGQEFMRGTWIIELPELSSLSKADANKAKQFLSLHEDRFRPSYGRTLIDWPRQCVFGGTTNEDRYHKDPTGAERFWSVRIGQRGEVDLDALRHDRDQLWAEAMARYRNGETWHPSKDEQALIRPQQEARYQGDAWEDDIVLWLRDQLKDQRYQRRDDGTAQWLAARFTISEIAQGAIKLDRAFIKPPEQQRIGAIMRRLGWLPCRPTIDGVRRNGYRPPLDWWERVGGEVAS